MIGTAFEVQDADVHHLPLVALLQQEGLPEEAGAVAPALLLSGQRSLQTGFPVSGQTILPGQSGRSEFAVARPAQLARPISIAAIVATIQVLRVMVSSPLFLAGVQVV